MRTRCRSLGIVAERREGAADGQVEDTPSGLRVPARRWLVGVLTVTLLAPLLSTLALPAPAAAQVPPASAFDKVQLAANIGEPMELAVLPDRRVLFITRNGDVKLYKPTTGGVTLAAHINVYDGQEDGGLGIETDPAFASNGWVYVYYSPAGSVPKQHLSRFRLVGDVLDLTTEQVILEVPTQRLQCCHSAGSLDFGPDGLLYLSTGDNTNSMASDGYTPIDERAGRNPWDAQKSSSNTNDLRGKILRIQVNANGAYSIPPGNLFPPGTAQTRPEIFSMGHRNPFRLQVDDETGWVFMSDVGPDAFNANATRGPAAHDEFNQIRTAGNYGWPYCGGPNIPYNDFNFATGASGALFNCASPTNNSPNNTGRVTNIPASRGPLIWYTANTSQFPGFGSGGRAPIGGPVYHFDPASTSEVKFPQVYDDTWFIGEWNRSWMKTVKLDAAGNIASVAEFMPGTSWVRPMDMEFGPDGNLFLLEYGSGFFGGSPEAALYRIDHVQGGRSPVARIGANRTSGPVPLAVTFSSAGSSDPDGNPITFAWDFTNNGSTDSTAANPSFTYQAAGTFTARLTVTDSTGRSASATLTVTAGNTAPTVTINGPVEGGVFGFGESVPFTVNATDPEDGGGISCARMDVDFVLGHDTHGHPISSAAGCAGTIVTGSEASHGPESNTFGILNAGYTDNGGLTGSRQISLFPRHKQAEYYSANSSAPVINAASAEGGKRIGDIHNGDWAAYGPLNLLNITGATYRVSSGGAGGTITLRKGSATGPALHTVQVPNTGGWDTYRLLSAPITNPGGTDTYYLVFTNPSSTGALLDVDFVEFQGPGVGGGGGGGPGPIVGVGGKCVDISNSGTADGTKVQLWTCNGSGAQQWALPGDGTVRALGKCLDVSNSGTADGTIVQLWTCNATGAQRWQPRGTGEQVELVNPQSAKCLDAAGGATADGTQLQLFTCNGGANQRWDLPGGTTTPPTCTGANDEFGGTALETCRWSTVVRPDSAALSVGGGFLNLATTQTDMAGTTVTGKNIVLQPVPTGSWTATTRVELNPTSTGPQAGLMLYSSDQDFAKAVFIQKANGRDLEWVPTIDSVFTHNPALDRSPLLPAGTSAVHVRLASDGTNVTASFSLDGTTFTPYGRAWPLASFPNAKIGLYASNGGSATAPVQARFDWFRVGGGGPAPGCGQVPEAGFTSLFNGTSTAGWSHAGPGGFTLTDCVLTATGGLGLHWYSARQFNDYALRLDFRLADAGDNSGVFVRFPNPGNDPFVAVNGGFEIQIDEQGAPDGAAIHRTGAIYDVKAPTAFNSLPPGQWNAYEVRVQGQQYTITLNGAVVNQFTNTNPNRGLPGFVGIQNHDNGSPVQFRNIRVQEL